MLTPSAPLTQSLTQSLLLALSIVQYGTLGPGIIVCAPQEALAGTRVSIDCPSDQENECSKLGRQLPLGERGTQCLSHLWSPRLLSSPLIPSAVQEHSQPSFERVSARSYHSPPPNPDTAQLSQKSAYPSALVLSLSGRTSPLRPAPESSFSTPFDCVLLPPVPPAAIDLAKVLVTSPSTASTVSASSHTILATAAPRTAA
ncbi:hypothetical protein BC826DRAFT_1108949 [Russula brevipes]|nr:hypothetical protein BC826DRAFT_1108949 [Russula brevipes]